MSNLLRQYIKSLLTEAPIDVWIKRHGSAERDEAEPLISDLTTKYKALLDTSAQDMVFYSLEMLKTLHSAIVKSKASNLRSSETKWLTAQMKKIWASRGEISLSQVDEDYIPTLKKYQKNAESLGPNFLNSISSIEDLDQKLNQILTNDNEEEVSLKDIGKIDEANGWAVFMPHTTAASCELGKTGGRRDTTWCTTRPEGKNLFPHYTLRAVLFYVIKLGVNATNSPWSKMSVGFKHSGEPVFDQGTGGMSVNADNQSLTEKKFREVLGDDIADRFLASMERATSSLGGKHPINHEFEKLSKSPKHFSDKLKSYGNAALNSEEGAAKKDFLNIILDYKVVPEVYEIISIDPDPAVREMLAQRKNELPREIIIKLLNDSNIDVISSALKRQDIPFDLFEKMSSSSLDYVQVGILKGLIKNSMSYRDRDLSKIINTILSHPNPSDEVKIQLIILYRVYNVDLDKDIISDDVLNKLVSDKNEDVRITAAEQVSSKSILDKLSYDSSPSVRIIVLKRIFDKNSDIGFTDKQKSDLARRFSNDESSSVQLSFAQFGDFDYLDQVSLSSLMNNANIGVRLNAALNSSASVADVLNFIKIQDKKDFEGIKQYDMHALASKAMESPGLPESIEALKILAKLKLSSLRAHIAVNSKKADVLMMFYDESDRIVKLGLANNRYTPKDLLQKLSQDSLKTVSSTALKTLEKIGERKAKAAVNKKTKAAVEVEGFVRQMVRALILDSSSKTKKYD